MKILFGNLAVSYQSVTDFISFHSQVQSFLADNTIQTIAGQKRGGQERMKQCAEFNSDQSEGQETSKKIPTYAVHSNCIMNTEYQPK